MAAIGQRCNPVAGLWNIALGWKRLSGILSTETGPALPSPRFTAGFDFGSRRNRGFHYQTWLESKPLLAGRPRTSNLAGKHLVPGSAHRARLSVTTHLVGTNIESGWKKPRTRMARRSNLAGTVLSLPDGTLIEPGWKKHRTRKEKIYV